MLIIVQSVNTLILVLIDLARGIHNLNFFKIIKEKLAVKFVVLN